MKNRIIWKGLSVSDFIHPGEEQAKNSFAKTPAYQKIVSAVSDVSLKLYKTVIEGTYIKLSPDTAPYIFAVLKDVCRILDYPNVPDIYLCHLMSQMVNPCSAGQDYILIADYVLETYDEEMLYYTFGNAITMIMAGHVKITTAAAYLPSGMLLTLPQIPFKQYLHLADATSDRGGLLACQSLAAAARCHFFELGIAPATSRRLFDTDKMAEEFIEKYLSSIKQKNGHNSALTKAAGWWVNATYIEGAANLMLKELYTWYLDGYQELVRKYSATAI